MDRMSMIGLFLIGLILIGSSIFFAPTEEEMAALKKQQDSIALIEKEVAAKASAQLKAATVAADSNLTAPAIPDSLNADSVNALLLSDKLGVFSAAGQGEEEIVSIENEVLKVNLTTRGGRIKSVELKQYKNFEGKPVRLFESDSTRFGLNFFAQNRIISTNDLYFKASGKGFSVAAKDSSTFTMRLEAGAPDRYLEYEYALTGDKYVIGFKVNFVGLNSIIASNTGYVELNWVEELIKQEKDMTAERTNATMYYMFADEDKEVDYLSETSDESEEIKTKVKWVAMKQQFFTQVLIADKDFDKPTRIETIAGVEEEPFVKRMKASFTLPYNHGQRESFAMHFYIGPNHYQYLKKAGDNLEKQIPLGWGIFGWVNRFIVIPIFNFLNSFNWNYGIIILILTIAIKVMLLPLTFKAYLSQAKMKVLKPEIDEIQGKFKEEPMKLQQEMMGLYRKAGVSPLGGCLPMLLQLPILIAMFRFFPQSIELRQESFLWAKDLSTYDSILDLPFSIWGYGDHVSLFTLLMTISTILITMVNSSSAMTNPQMKWMMYLMPIVFLGVFNNYSAGLSYYYFLANVISIGQQFLFKSFVDDDEIHRKIQENKKRPASQTKSKFQQRLEKMAKEKGYKMPK
ncbi:MAG: membrane protein insertase YidC [Bacteroidetes bacterium]|nr:membrane protein insertase YidC [Bacteroidota bacterium]